MYGTLPSIPIFHISRLLPCLLRRPEGPIAFANYVEADVARAAAAATVLRAVPAMPNRNFPLRLAFGAPACRLCVKPLCAQFAGDLVFPCKKARKRLLVRTVPRAVPNNVRHVKSKPARLGLPRLVALPGGIAGVEVRGAVDKRR